MILTFKFFEENISLVLILSRTSTNLSKFACQQCQVCFLDEYHQIKIE